MKSVMPYLYIEADEKIENSQFLIRNSKFVIRNLYFVIQKMSLKNKNRTPWFLVVASMVLLFLFVGYWNVSTYLNEKKQLAEDVEIQLQLAYTETKDSELVYFIRTQLSRNGDEENFPDSISIFFDSNPISPNQNGWLDHPKADKLLENHISGDTTFIIDLDYDAPDSILHSETLTSTEIRVISSPNVSSILVDSLDFNDSDSSKFEFRLKQVNIKEFPDSRKNRKRILHDSNYIKSWKNDTDSLPSRLRSVFEFKGDSLSTPFRFNDQPLSPSNASIDKTYKLFKQKLIANNLPFNFDIIKDKNTLSDGLRVTYESNGFGFIDWIIDLKNYQIFIFKKMIPTMLFSLFLLGIISLAFWTLLRNWIRQNRLVMVKNEFINNMTHELKTPIATVGVALEAISNFDLSTEQDKTKEYLDISRKEITRLSLLVDKVLNIATFDSNEIALKAEVVDLNQIIQNNIQSLKLQLADKNAEINFENNVTSSIILGDKLHMDNSINNIIDNALKYSLTNPKIDISINEDPRNLILTFKDNGKGIPKEYQNKVFDRFFRVPSEDIHDVKGHGLGLNYVQNVVQSHGGKIVLESVENQGSTFTITLPKSDSNV